MSSPINTESRNFTSFPFLSPLSSPLSNLSTSDWKLSSRNVSPIRLSLRRHTFLVLLVLILDFQHTNLTEGAFSIEHERRPSEAVETEQSHVPLNPPTLISSSERSTIIFTKRYQPGKDLFSTSSPHRTSRLAHAIKHGPMEELNGQQTKKIIKQEAIIHEDNLSAIPSQRKTEPSEFTAIFPSSSIERSKESDNNTIEISEISGNTFDDSKRFIGEKRTGRIFYETTVSSKEKKLGLYNETNWKRTEKMRGEEQKIGRASGIDRILLSYENSFVGTDGTLNETVDGSQYNVNDRFKSFQKFINEPSRKEERIGRISAIDLISLSDEKSFVTTEENSNEAVVGLKGNVKGGIESFQRVNKNPSGEEKKIGNNLAENPVSLRPEISFLNNKSIWIGSQDSVNDDFESSQKFSEKPIRQERRIGGNSVVNRVSTKVENSFLNAEENSNKKIADSLKRISDGLERAQTLTGKLTETKVTIGRNLARDPMSSRSEESSSNNDKTGNGTIAGSPDNVSDESKRFQKFIKKPIENEAQIGWNVPEDPMSSRPELLSLNNKNTWNGTTTELPINVTDEFETFQKFTTKPANEEVKIGTNLGEDPMSSSPELLSLNNKNIWNGTATELPINVTDEFETFQKFTTKPAKEEVKIGTNLGEDPMSSSPELSPFNNETTWNETVDGLPDNVGNESETFQKVIIKQTKNVEKTLRNLAEDPMSSRPENPLFNNKNLWNSTLTTSQSSINNEFDTLKKSIIPTKRKSNIPSPPEKSTSVLSTFTITNKLIRAKRIGRKSAVNPTSSNSENSSMNMEENGNKTVVVSQDSVNDDIESPEKFAEKPTYKPPAQPPPASPVEKYDRRHFGPPRLESLEEISKEMSEATGSSSASSHIFQFSFYFTEPSSSPFTPSSSAQLPNSPNRPEISVVGTSGSNHNRNDDYDADDDHDDDDDDDDDDDVTVIDKLVNQREFEITSGEKFNPDNKPNANETKDVSSTIDRLHDQVEAITKPSTNADGFELPQSSTAISKLSDLRHRKLPTMQPHDIIDVTAAAPAAPEGTSASRHKPVDKLELTILGLFELTQGSEPRPEGPSELQAARLAVDRINHMGVLPNIHLRLIHNDTRCDPGVAVDRFFYALYTSKNTSVMPLLLGTACSEVTETLAKIAPYWNIVQVSYGSTAPALSDPTEFPLFVRTVAPDSSHNPARISLIKRFGWDTVAALSQNGDMYSLAVNDLVTELEQANITCTATITFGENDYKEQLRSLKELDTRIIIGSFSPGLAPRLFCEAWKLGMHGGDYAWILPGETIDLSGMTGDWWHSGPEDCTPPQLSQTLDGLIIVKSYGTSPAERPSYSGLTTAEFTSELAKRGVTLSRYAGQTYDAVWSMALALGNLESFLNQRNSSIAQYNHSRKDVAYHLLEKLKGLNFLGVSGPVSFDGADRVGITAFYQMQGHVVRRVALYTPEDGQLTMNCPGCARIRWPGEHPPVARRVFRFRMVTIEYAAFLAVTCLASIGVTLALAFLAFNLHFRKHKSIKLSSPRLNNMAAFGCALVYGAVILLGLDHATLSNSDGYFPTICTARAYLLSAGFSLAFGSMFTKTYRVHRIFTRSRSGVVKNKLLQDTQLISLICVLLLIDCLVVTLWVTLDPMQRDLRNLTLEINPQDRSVIYQPQVEVCRSQHTNGWLAALYAYKGLLLIVGVYMAWETRHVKIPALNDSQYIGMSVYSVVITSGIVVVLANLMSDRATLAFVTITTLILASTTATLALLFLPQLANILGGERADPVVQSLGLKIECNTRRFVTDDSRELQYRVEVQNRVYRREMAQLELELARLEKQLGQEPVEPSDASSSTSIPQRNPSISGGLPLLLLSVLPPVIPRASWPSADSSGMRRGTVAFSSQPVLEPDGPRRSLADIYKLQWRRDTEGPSRLGVFQRLFSLFGSRPSSRKTSTASVTGVASALRVHMGYIAGLVPGTKASSSCQVNVQGIRTPHPRCGSGPIISITSEEDRRLSLGLRRKESSEPRVNFSLPSKSNTSQSSSRERIRGSPRFPHRIVPANSLSAIAPGSMTAAHQRWHSMEDASKQKIFSCTPRGSTYGPSYDVWATREKGIPLSEFNDRTGARKVPESLALTIQSDLKVSPDDCLLGSDLRKLFRENSTTFSVNDEVATPLEGNSKNSKIVPSPRTSPTKITLTRTSEIESCFARTSTNDSVQDIEISIGNESKNCHLSLSKSKVVVICENNDHFVDPEFLLKATTSSNELSTEEVQPIDEESCGQCED